MLDEGAHGREQQDTCFTLLIDQEVVDSSLCQGWLLISQLPSC